MRVVMDGPFWLEYGQIFVDGAGEYVAPTDAFAGQRNGLCGAAVAGRLLLRTGLHTGKVGFRVEVHERMPSVEYDAEDVAEASYVPEGKPQLRSLGGEPVLLDLEDVSYRVRYSAWGMDAGHQSGPPADDDSLVDRYLLQLWPARVAPERVVKETSRQAAYRNRITREGPTPKQLAAKRQERARQQEEERTARKLAAWGGRPPTERLRDSYHARRLSGVDRPLVDALERADEETQRAVARWAARRACIEAGYDQDEHLATILGRMDRGDDLYPLRHPPSEPPAKSGLVLETTRDWQADATPLENVKSVVRPAYDQDPLRAALKTVLSSLGAFPNKQVLLGELRLAFPELL
jgi:hypothetical protein